MKDDSMPETVCPRLDRGVPCTYPRCNCPVSYAPADEHIDPKEHFADCVHPPLEEISPEFAFKAIIGICDTRGYTHEQDRDAIRATAKMGLRLLKERQDK
jgi:hypothetical protein